jgi:hypothetical protein
MSIKSRVFPLSFLILTLNVAFCWAQEEPTIEIPAFHFSEPLPAFSVGGYIDVAVTLAELVRAGGPDGLQARIFRGSRRNLESRSQSLMGDGCVFYRAGIFSLGQSAKGLQVLTTIHGPAYTLNRGWLSFDEPNVGGDQYFVVVIEKRTAAKDYLRIRPEDVSRYFAKGLEFVVKSNLRLSPEDEKKLFTEGRERLAETVTVANREIPLDGQVKSRCRSFSMIQTTGTAYLWNDPCPGSIVAQAAAPIGSMSLAFAALSALR